jgi:thiamine-monophosphate kinase
MSRANQAVCTANIFPPDWFWRNGLIEAMRETDLIRRIKSFAQATGTSSRIIKSIGDDCAVVRPQRGHDLVFTTDFTIEDRHFTRLSHSAADVGHKALARSLSDLAAMGADPLFFLVSLALPPSVEASWITGFYKGMTALAKRFRIVLAGGDLARAEKTVADVMCCGTVPSRLALLRSGAHPTDRIYVTGRLGVSALGFAEQRGAAWKRHKRPEPRLEVGNQLRRLATAAMDLSDGLSLDLFRLCAESQVGACLSESLPIAKGASLQQALHGGEDYELLFTASRQKKIPAKIAGIDVTCIGEITNSTGTITYGGNVLEPLGFDHFR